MAPEVEVMDEGVLLVTYVDECRVEPRHDFTDLSQVDVADGEPGLALLFGKLDQDLVLAQGDGNLGRADVYD